jgi:uncharacterized LabA/DUF88 family protein
MMSVYPPSVEPVPPLGRMMAFIDGENIVARYQETLRAGKVPDERVAYKRDVFAWHPAAIWCGYNVVERATFYTYQVGSEEVLQTTATEIQALQFDQFRSHLQTMSNRLVQQLHPRVFRKVKGGRAPKGVDIQLTIDVLTHAYQDNLDTVFLVTGDGDFEPLIAECQRRGKKVWVAAFSNGLNPRLKIVADSFIDLDHVFFRAEAPPAESKPGG